MKSYNNFTDEELLLHAIRCAGDEWQLGKLLGKSFKTVAMWKSPKRKAWLPKGVRPHLLLLLETTLRETPQAPPERKLRQVEGGRKA